MTDTPKDVRTVARKRLEERRGFVPHVILYIVINAGLVFIWTTTAPEAFFWPIFPILFWGAGVVTHAWSAFLSKPITEADVDREAERLGRPADEPGTNWPDGSPGPTAGTAL